jgi:hypothetical protein
MNQQEEEETQESKPSFPLLAIDFFTSSLRARALHNEGDME